MKNRYNRKTTGITISIFYEHYQLSKYNFEPPYQRDYNVWSSEQKSFLVDTILKNFPMPPIFLEQKIDTSNGKTRYDVIDGKQRLFAIIEFIENTVKLPMTFGKDDYGLDLLNGKTFEEIKSLASTREDIQEFISSFWGYVISIEYIENPDVKVVDNIFDRLNRGGERLNPQELRKANFYDTIVYKDIELLRQDEFLSDQLRDLDKNRLEDISFITELYLLIKLEKIIDGTENQIDKYFKEIVEEINQEESNQIVQKLHEIKHIVSRFNLNYDLLRIRGVSHLYAVWYLAYYMYTKYIDVSDSFIEKLNEFYIDLRNNRENVNTFEYHKSMQSASKYKYSRKKRVSALLNYFEYSFNADDL